MWYQHISFIKTFEDSIHDTTRIIWSDLIYPNKSGKRYSPEGNLSNARFYCSPFSFVLIMSEKWHVEESCPLESNCLALFAVMAMPVSFLISELPWYTYKGAWLEGEINRVEKIEKVTEVVTPTWDRLDNPFCGTLGDCVSHDHYLWFPIW